MQIEMLLLSSVDTHLPTMLRIVPGSIKDVETLSTTIEDLKIDKITFVFDRGSFSEENIKTLYKSDINFIIPARRNSFLYEKVKRSFENHFFYHERLIKCSKKRWSLFYLYLFEDSELKKEEERTLYKLLDEKRIEYEEFKERIKNAGRVLMISSLNRDEKQIYELYKSRDEVEKHFDTTKNTLRSDIVYLQDDESVFGHMFVSFLSLYGYCTIQNMLRKSELLNKVSPIDVLEEFSTVYVIEGDDNQVITEISKKVKILDEKLGTNINPKNRS